MRAATVGRSTNETQIKATINLDGTGTGKVETGIGFFDHMLVSFARHGLFDLELHCAGDLEVDTHHTVEDVGIVLGEAVKQALGDKAGIRRYGSCLLPMDDALILCALDLSGRPYLEEDLNLGTQKIGDMDSEMLLEFFYAFSYSAGANLHFIQHRGKNAHHIAEACFKAFAKALDAATSYEPRTKEVWSTKGVL
ncbi:MAG: imidazoleglycerol-phosphate dehydratase HisB [Oscillospiraceae bacterium]|nr:imidazoleglycerol-phosphate dehydratase HisB [Oscillospiraceae bacterium]